MAEVMVEENKIYRGWVVRGGDYYTTYNLIPEALRHTASRLLYRLLKVVR
jgi:hypothetical protein